MKNKTRILIAEHDPADIELLNNELLRGGISYIAEVVKNEQDYLTALQTFVPDIILSDYTFPSFDGPAAFRLRETIAPGTPFIFVSGTIGEELSIELMRNGVTDFVFKGSLATLTNKMVRALREATERRWKVNADLELKRSEKKYRQIIEIAQEGIWIIDAGNKTTFVNKKMCEILEYTEAEMMGRTNLSFKDTDEQQVALQQIERRKNGVKETHESRFITKSGRNIIVQVATNALLDEDGSYAGALAMMTDITEKRRAGQELVWLINNTEESFILLDRDLRITTFNNQFEELYFNYFGIRVRKGAFVLDYAQAERKALVKEIYDKVIAGYEKSDEIVIPMPDRSVKIFGIKYKPAKNEKAEIIGAFVTIIDITDKKKSGQQLLINEKRYRSLVENSADAVVILSPDGKPLYVSPTVETILGYTEKEAMELDMFSLTHPDDVAGVEKIWEQVMRSPGRPVPGVISRLRHKDGSWRWLEDTITNRLHDPAINGIVDNFRDVTGKIEAEKLQQLERNGTEALINTTQDLMWSASSTFTLIAANQAFVDYMKHFTGETLKPGDPLLRKENFPAQYLTFWEALYGRALSGEPLVNETYTPAGENLSEQWFETTLNPIYNGTAITGIACYARDITAQRQKEQHLRLLESVITNTTDAILITEAEPFDEPGPKIVYVNEAFTKMTGYSAAEVIGQTPRILQGPKSDKAELRRFGEAIRKWQPCELTLINYKKNGEGFWINFSVSPVANEGGRYTHWISIEKDVTERKLLEIHLNELNENLQKQASELVLSNAELEQFAYVASHDLQEPLRMVTSFLLLLEKKYGAVIDEKGKQYIAFAVDGARRMRQIILDLLEFSRVGRTEDSAENVDLNDVVNEIRILFRKQIEESKAVIMAGTLPRVTAHRGPMRQVFQNLIGNALKYTRENVPPRIQIGATEFETHWQFAVSDNGLGIAAEYFDKVFIIFQRLHNKDEFSGTGMGLAVTKKIIETLRGKIWLTSEEGKGSIFYFTIRK